MLRLWFRRLSLAAGSKGALALALGVGYVQAREDSADSDSSRESRTSDSKDSDRDSDRNRRDEDRDNDRDARQSHRENPHHQPALGVLLYQNSLDVRRVIPDSPADDAGLRRDDEILTVDGDRVKTPEQLIRRIRQMGDDERVKLGILRDGEHKTITARLSSRESVFGDRDSQYGDRYGMQPRRGNRQYSRSPDDYGRSYDEINDQGRNYGGNWREQEPYSMNPRDYQSYGGPGGRRQGYAYDRRGDYDPDYGRPPEEYREDEDRFARYRRSRRGALGVTLDEESRGAVRIHHVYRGGPAEDAGLKPGDEIVAVDGRRVRGAEDLLRVLAGKHPDEEIALAIDRDGRERTVHATLGRPSEVFADEEEEYRTSRAPNRGGQQRSEDGRSYRDSSDRDDADARGSSDERRSDEEDDDRQD